MSKGWHLMFKLNIKNMNEKSSGSFYDRFNKAVSQAPRVNDPSSQQMIDNLNMNVSEEKYMRDVIDNKVENNGLLKEHNINPDDIKTKYTVPLSDGKEVIGSVYLATINLARLFTKNDTLILRALDYFNDKFNLTKAHQDMLVEIRTQDRSLDSLGSKISIQLLRQFARNHKSRSPKANHYFESLFKYFERLFAENVHTKPLYQRISEI